MSYDLTLYFRSPDFSAAEWSEILSWFDAIERTDEPNIFERESYLGKEWVIPVGDYGIFCAAYGCHPLYLFKDAQAHWEVAIGTGSGFGLRQFFGYTLCYCALSLIPGTSVWDCGQYFYSLEQEPGKFLRKVNALINTHYLYQKEKRRLKMRQMGVMDENFQLIPDPYVLKLAAQSDLYNG